MLENNELHAVVQVRDRTEKILYFEGEPRWEVKYLLRAVEDDENLQVVLLQRTAENKFFRRNLDDPLELVEGFPTTRADLYRYRALVLGSVEASFFTHDQLEMIADFVNERGGTLLTLGGRRAFAEGGYKGTPLEDVLPVVLDEPTGATPHRAPRPHQGRPHARRREPPGHPHRRLGRTVRRPLGLPSPGHHHQRRHGAQAGSHRTPPGNGRAGRRRGRRRRPDRHGLPALRQGPLARARGAGHLALADGPHRAPRGPEPRDLLAAAAPLDGGRHARPPVETAPSRESVETGEPVSIEATVLDEGFVEVNGARVTARITTPTGDVQELPMEWSVTEDGRYTVPFTPEMEGIYEVSVDAGRDTVTLGTGETAVRVAPGGEEFRDPHQRRSLMERIAEETGGRYYTAETAGRLPEDLRYTGGGVTVTEERDLWDMPLLFLLLAGLLGAEWGYRRKKGLA